MYIAITHLTTHVYLDAVVCLSMDHTQGIRVEDIALSRSFYSHSHDLHNMTSGHLWIYNEHRYALPFKCKATNSNYYCKRELFGMEDVRGLRAICTSDYNVIISDWGLLLNLASCYKIQLPPFINSCVMNIFDLPCDLLTQVICSYLKKNECYRFFSLCSDTSSLLSKIRTITLHGKTWKRFRDKEAYRARVLNILGYATIKQDHDPSNGGCTQRKLKVSLYNPTILTDEDTAMFMKYGQLIQSFYIKTDPQNDNTPSLQLIYNLHSHLKPTSNFACVSLRPLDLYKLHRLIINEQHEIVNLHVLSPDYDPVIDDKHRPLSELRGIKLIRRMNDEEEITLLIQHGATLETFQPPLVFNKITILPHERFFTCCKGLHRLSVTTHVSHLKHVTLACCNFITDVSCLAHLQRVDLYQLHELLDISALGNVIELNVIECSKIERFPIPLMHQHQKWCFERVNIVDLAGYGRLRGLNLRKCDVVIDTSMIGAVRELHVYDCENIVHFPKPTGRYQSWSFGSCNIADVSGFETLISLSLWSCPNITDNSMLGAVKILDIDTCVNITNFPVTTGKGQRWYFTNSNISDLTGYHVLDELITCGCDKVRDISMLDKVRSLNIMSCRHFSSDINRELSSTE